MISGSTPQLYRQRKQRASARNPARLIVTYLKSFRERATPGHTKEFDLAVNNLRGFGTAVSIQSISDDDAKSASQN